MAKRGRPLKVKPECIHAETEEIAYDEPLVGRNVAADRCVICGAVRMRGIGTIWVLPGERMGA